MNRSGLPAARRTKVLRFSAVALASLALVACGDDDGGGASPSTRPTTTTTPARPTTPPTRPTTPPTRPTTPVRPTPPPTHAAPTTDGGGGMQAGAPRFETFEVSSSVPCTDGNADATMSYTTLNVVDLEIKIGDGNFAETAGYGPNETSVIASIPCSGAGSSTVQMRGCTESRDCVESPVRTVTITG